MSPRLPRLPSKGESIYQWAEQVQMYLRSLTPQSAPGLRVNHQYNGTTYSVDDTPAPGESAPAVNYPWQTIASEWTGTGADPNAADRKMRVKFLRGQVNGFPPSNMNDEFLCFGDPEDLTIDESDAVVTKVYLKLPIASTGADVESLVLNAPLIQIVEGTLTDSLDSLVSPPAFGSDGTLPPYVIYPICDILYYNGAIDFSVPGLASYLNVQLVVTDFDCEAISRGVQFTRT